MDEIQKLASLIGASYQGDGNTMLVYIDRNNDDGKEENLVTLFAGLYLRMVSFDFVF